MCCLHLRLLYGLWMLHVWLAHPWMVLDLMHCHHVCWGWAVHVEHDWTLKRHALHCDGISTSPWCSWLHHHVLQSRPMPMLHVLLVWHPPVLLLWQWRHQSRALLRGMGAPDPVVSFHNHLYCQLPAGKRDCIDHTDLSVRCCTCVSKHLRNVTGTSPPLSHEKKPKKPSHSAPDGSSTAYEPSIVHCLLTVLGRDADTAV